MKELSDEQLMKEVAGGNLEALRFLFDRHHVYLYNFLYKMCGDEMLSEDLCQDVFYNIVRYRTSYKNGKFVSWMFTIARNSLSSHFRQHRAKNAPLDELPLQVEPPENETSENISQLQLALNQLETSDRELLILNRLHEIKYKELSEIVGSTPGAIKTKVSRALKKLRKIYFQTVQE
ncbi:RNA polymerase sigma factor [Sinomicrobium weinanense]|uniref:RNA polymerase sigma factor n=1 Tax=Sinomicrobium weinanense TaxID=2842200 RepID=A0A926JW03_9FLAO|nr:RNA polymerase sigma factor [Sinomicrobium weinanense]MBC9798615.1 RNA polymerase sigma factor [Sinomicrobium weinanense]MBU3124482.1 RNA polymerase sigma factor [Sinomicrobium weinanense]